MKRILLVILALAPSACGPFLSGAARSDVVVDAIVVGTVFAAEHGDGLVCAMAAGTCNLDDED